MERTGVPGKGAGSGTHMHRRGCVRLHTLWGGGGIEEEAEAENHL